MTLPQILARFLNGMGMASAVVLLASSGLLVYYQYEVRQLFIALERSHELERQLREEASQLATRYARASLPARMNARAEQLGFTTPTMTQSVLIEVPAEQLDPAPGEPRREARP